jgi:phosphatidylserine/phosphatidylglycerophosphate/cardiolipin synthase-like enzyme
MSKRFIQVVLLGIFLLVYFYIPLEELPIHFEKTSTYYSEPVTLKTLAFCPEDSCLHLWDAVLNNATQSISCAVYDLTHPKILETLHLKASQGVITKILIDSKNTFPSNVNFVIKTDKQRKSKYDNLMHEKFCIIDGEYVLTGSANPTINGLEKNDNVIFLFQSKQLAQYFQEEFTMMYEYDIFGTNKQTQSPFISKTNSSVIEFYFCPQFNCENIVVSELSKAEHSIYFANFVLTSDPVETMLEEKSKELVVEGIIEKRMVNSKGSKILNLSKTFQIQNDTNPKTMHHKYFIIDNQTVLVGSVNPTKSGFYYNDETLMVIRDNSIVQRFLENYLSLKP